MSLCGICVVREYMLTVLLHLTLDLLKDGPLDNRDSTVGGILANTLLKVSLRLYYCSHQCTSGHVNGVALFLLYSRHYWCVICERRWCLVWLLSCGTAF